MKALSLAAILLSGSLLSGCATLAIGGFITASMITQGVVTGAVSASTGYFVRRAWEDRYDRYGRYYYDRRNYRAQGRMARARY